MTGTGGFNPLAKLTSPLAGAGRVAQAAGGSLSTAGADFASLLEQAQQGELSSGMRVEIGRGSNVELSEDQIARLSAAADKAEAAGMTRAVAFIDGQAVVLDVQTRTITGKFDPAKDFLTDIDGVLGVPGMPAAGAADQPGAGGLVGQLLNLPRVPLDVLTKLAGG